LAPEHQVEVKDSEGSQSNLL